MEIRFEVNINLRLVRWLNVLRGSNLYTKTEYILQGYIPWFASLEILNVWNDMVHWNKSMPLISMQVFLLFELLDVLTNHQLLFSQLTMMRCHSTVEYLFIGWIPSSDTE